MVKIITDLNELDNMGRAEEIPYEENEKEIREIASKLRKLIRKNNLTALSAPAIGYNKRIFCIDFSDKEIKTFINPLIVNISGLELTREVCSSIPNKEFIIPRNTEVDFMYTTLNGEIKHQLFKGAAASVVLHEFDHLDGINISDIGLEIDDDFDSATEAERQEVLDMYLNYINSLKEDINTEIQTDDNLKKEYDADRLVEALATGKIELEAVQGIKED